MSRSLLAAAAAGFVALSAAQAAPMTMQGMTLSLSGDADALSLGAVGGAVMAETGGVTFTGAAANDLVGGDAFGGVDVGTGVTLTGGEGVMVALTDLTVVDDVMFGRITVEGVPGVGGLVMYGSQALFAVEEASGGFELMMDDMVGDILADALGMDLGGTMVAQLSAAPTPTPVPGAMFFFLTGAGALAARRAAKR